MTWSPIQLAQHDRLSSAKEMQLTLHRPGLARWSSCSPDTPNFVTLK